MTRDYSKVNACPECGSSRVVKRTTLSPKWKCYDCRTAHTDIERRDARRSPPSEPFNGPTQVGSCPRCGEEYTPPLASHIRHECQT